MGDLLVEIISKVRIVAMDGNQNWGNNCRKKRAESRGLILEVLFYFLVSGSRKKNQKC